MRQGAAVDQFQFATERHAMGDARGDQAFADEDLSDIVRSGLALHRRVGGQDHFAESTGIDALQQRRNTDGLWPQAIER